MSAARQFLSLIPGTTAPVGNPLASYPPVWAPNPGSGHGVTGEHALHRVQTHVPSGGIAGRGVLGFRNSTNVSLLPLGHGSTVISTSESPRERPMPFRFPIGHGAGGVHVDHR